MPTPPQMARRASRIVLLCAPPACALVLGACGGSSASGTIAAADAARLRTDVSAVTRAVQGRSRPDALTAVGRLRGEIQSLERSGRLSSTDARTLLAVAARLPGQIDAQLPAPTTTATTTATHATTAPAVTRTVTTPAPVPPAPKHAPKPGPPGQQPRHGHGHGAGGPPGHRAGGPHGHGGGHGGDGGGD